MLQQSRNTELESQIVRGSQSEVAEEPSEEPAALGEESEPGWFRGVESEDLETTLEGADAEGECETSAEQEEEQRDVQYLDVDLSSVRLLAEQVPEQRWSAAIEMQSVFRTMSQSLRWRDELLASDVLTRVIRRFLVRHRLKMQFEEVRKEAIQISRTQMLECEKVIASTLNAVVNLTCVDRYCAAIIFLTGLPMWLLRSGG